MIYNMLQLVTVEAQLTERFHFVGHMLKGINLVVWKEGAGYFSLIFGGRS